ncbi:Fibronectin type III domain-containing protein 5 [Ilyodon furcidens]|uniref:Fibronectin type III domain-containing protein 5 n=1 Tax=Ilyodon furcidens TaxID=33524 RepID=A0ABV0TB37_9TELE
MQQVSILSSAVSQVIHQNISHRQQAERKLKTKEKQKKAYFGLSSLFLNSEQKVFLPISLSADSLSPPINVTIKEVKANSAVVSWDIPEGDPVIGFAITQQKKDVRMLRFIQEVNTTTRSCALWDLEEETDYIVHVQSISMSGTSPLSEPLRFRTPKEAETQASKSKEPHTNTLTYLIIHT